MEQPLGSSDHGKTVLTGQTSRFGFETSTPMGNGAFNTKIEADFYGYCGSSATATACACATPMASTPAG